MKSDTVKNFSKWHSINEIPKLNSYILMSDEIGVNFHTGIILKETGFMFIDQFTGFWNDIIKKCEVKYWIYISEIDVKRKKVYF